MRIDFYILTDDSPNARAQLSCRLAEKAWKAGHSVYLHAGTREQSAELDDLLWTFRDGSFVPHARVDVRSNNGEAAAPILIGNGIEPPPGTDMLINLDREVPGFYAQFARIAEIVEPQDRAAGRARFRFYRDQGLEPHTHNL